MLTLKIKELKMLGKNERDVTKKIEWLCDSLGMLSKRDKDRTSARILELLLNSAKRNEGLTSESIAVSLNISRSTALHHLERYASSGIVVKDNGYHLRCSSVEEVIDEIELEIKRSLERIRKIAREIDESLGLG